MLQPISIDVYICVCTYVQSYIYIYRCVFFIPVRDHISSVNSCTFSGLFAISFKVSAIKANILRRESWVLDVGNHPFRPFFRYPRCSMYGIFTYIYPKNDPYVGKYSLHGTYWYLRIAWFLGTNLSFDPYILLRRCP